MKEALYWEKQGEKTKCLLCPHNCIISEGKAGVCGVRRNTGGKLYSLNYGKVTSISMDPIEKKPLYHFHPGSTILSMGTAGCNFHCDFCQNWSISQDAKAPVDEITPEQAVRTAQKHASFGICYTYNEPFIWFEFVLETARLAKKAGLKNVLVTNGSVSREPLAEVLPFIDAANIDLKAMDEDFYAKICKGKLGPVLDTIKAMHGKAHIELTNLVVPTLNDSPEKIAKLVDWVAEVGADIPLHFSRYHPCYKMDIPPTPEDTLKTARKIAMKKLKYVYIGNVWDPGSDATYCPKCGKPVIERSGFSVTRFKVKEGKCGYCGEKVDVIQ
ncbi:AmmeMemoRadiSam system radical SAM enzyme [Candidatus Desantisbacteria bacterium CG_4_10_14_0_8_um_filter_48_22]|uniref:AmmeMemoRadiSam system radical SAM enzyme n=1 Tax=Candidatus Desantisbacteria bacterium CG_4_10_14_0_8_um_filter_48_22 TaxID=1974543 RepID=A0A2M7S7E5_9BACT|nr:MAG: AmmeMemoRadiSam system radical SAM enzyme [Candidatus Desantisbacteria bacterium CG1_02_49_89]PIV55335.1 MAG: AmmeMemoRadiSam system radical SAM enzyme [Candidatus Desantisbacteria bacterium CG02_land_8_20_14_3_00_49_13]PIZ15451.1 MAG: AmmeMemoRadiSam system radical SAM enzyme [Candidatus Desantisbacteria bacterium CG_4_10_14_0_8_um_filter_48_22]